MEIKDLESKVWFRFLKVVFVFTYLATFLAVLVFAYSSKPYSITDEYNSMIVCDNGTNYKAGDNGGIDPEQALAEQLGGRRVNLNGATPEKDKATLLCLGYTHGFIPDTLTDAEMSKLKSQTPPYKVEIVKKTVGNWWSFIGYTVLALFIVVVILEVIKRSFFYIAIGKKFLR